MSIIARLAMKGDLVCTKAQGGGLLSNTILLLQRAPGEERSESSHTAVVREVRTDLVILREQTMPAIRDAGLEQTYNAYQLWRLRDLSPIERDKIAKLAARRHGAYGVTKIGLFLLDALLARVISLPIVLIGRLFGRRWRGVEPAVFSRLNVTGMLVCSQWVAKLYYDAVGYEFGGHYLTMTPDKIQDYVRGHSEWELVANVSMGQGKSKP